MAGDTDIQSMTATDTYRLLAHASQTANIWEITASDGTTIKIGITAAGLPIYSTTVGITASVTQTQGQQPLTTHTNEISTCANANDTVTLPAAVAGVEVVVINNGANTLRVFPASGDDLGQGVNTQTTIAASNTTRFSAYDTTNWRPS